MDSVVVTGVGAVTPLGVGAEALYRGWRDGVCGVEGGEGACADFDPTAFMSAKETRRADRFTQLAIAASEEAVADAGWVAGSPYEAHRIGCILGTGIGGIATLVQGQDALRERGPDAVSPLAVPLMMSNAGAAALSIRYGLAGPSMAVSTACAAGAHALGYAARMLERGEADAMLAGGSEAALTPLARAAFSALDALSVTGISRPFDVRRDGFVMGEGAAVLVLERSGDAAARGVQTLGRIRGFGASSDAHHVTAPRADGVGQSAAILNALADAAVDADQIDYVNAHGTSTPLNDRAETNALKLALGAHAGRIPVSSTKASIGHLLGAAGAVEAVATLLALNERVAPPTIGLTEPEPGLDLDYVPDSVRALRSVDGRSALALSNSFGFGGHNAVLCLEAS